MSQVKLSRLVILSIDNIWLAILEYEDLINNFASKKAKKIYSK